jgi:Na+/melibiose symporter-like transporter
MAPPLARHRVLSIVSVVDAVNDPPVGVLSPDTVIKTKSRRLYSSLW